MANRKPKTRIAPKRDQSVEDIAAEFDVDPETVRRWVRAGCSATRQGAGRPTLLNSVEVAAWMRANGITGRAGRPSHAADSPDLEAARLRKENALASRYELQVARERGELVPTIEVRQVVVRMLTTFRNKLRGVPATASPLMDGRDGAEREAILAKSIDECLNDLADAVREFCGGPAATA